MAEDTPKPKRRLVKKAETVRQKVEKQAEAEKKPRRLQKTTRRASAPFRLIGRGFKKLGTYKFFRVIGYIFVPPYFRNSWRELRQVTWPSFKLSVRLTIAVIIFALVFGALVTALDFVLEKLFREVLLK